LRGKFEKEKEKKKGQIESKRVKYTKTVTKKAKKVRDDQIYSPPVKMTLVSKVIATSTVVVPKLFGPDQDQFFGKV
jgi:hypothetical protein